MFLEYLTARDYDRLAARMAGGVRFRALRRNGPSDWRGRAAATDGFQSWFGPAGKLEVVDATIGEIAARLRMTWRIRMRPAPFSIGDGWHLVEQHAVADVAEAMEALDLVCSGFRRPLK
jgi:hypothetical protein